MYLAHFGLREAPFGITPDTSFVFAGTAHQEALNTLLVALEGGEGIVKVTGEVGTGKTLLCRRFLAALGGPSLGKYYRAAYLHNPCLEPKTLLKVLAEELGVALAGADDEYHLLKGLNKALLDIARQGKSVVVCVDEAQAIPTESIETVRLLSNLETEKRKLLRLVLFGQPELDARLSDPSVRQIKQRIAFHYELGGLKPEEVTHYLDHRLRVAGYRGNPLFSPAAVRIIARTTSGIPRLVNIVAHKSLICAFGEGVHEVMPRHVLAAVRDTDGLRRPHWYWW